MNAKGATTSNEDSQSGTRDIVFPNQVTDVDEIAIDIGGTLAKVTYFSKKRGGEGRRLHFHRFPTESINDFIAFVERIIDDADGKRISKIKATGGGAHKYFELLSDKLKVEVTREDEMGCLINGLNFLLQQVSYEVFTYHEGQPLQFEDVKTSRQMYPYMLVNIGSGVSILKVSGENQFERISGTSLGGGTLWGLLSLLTDCKDFDEMLKLSTTGDNKNVDMLVGDIYGTDYSSVGLKASTIASSFGKVFRRDFPKEKVRPQDIAKSALFMISNNIGQIAYLNAVSHNLRSIYFGGSFIRGHMDTMRTISYAINFWSKGTMKALFLRHDGYLGCLGALVKDWIRPDVKERQSFEENFVKSFSMSPVGNLGVLDTVPEPLVPFPLLYDPASYEPDTISLQEPNLRNYWLSVFDRNIEVTSKAVRNASQEEGIEDKLNKFEKAFKEMIIKLKADPGSYGQLSVRSLLNLKEQCLHEYVSLDPYKQIKEKENAIALEHLPLRLKKLDTLSPEQRLRDIIDGILAGNMFDWGAKDVMDMLIKGELDFENAGLKIVRPGLKDNYNEFEQRFLKQTPYSRCFIFLDNSGADTILGVIPFARELLSRGTKVILAANSTPALNDVTFDEVETLFEDISKIDGLLNESIYNQNLTCVSTGSGSPCLNLLRVTEKCANIAQEVDLVVIVGMGRAVHTNYYAKFLCDSLKLAVIKNESVANFLGGGIFDAICFFEETNLLKRN